MGILRRISPETQALFVNDSDVRKEVINEHVVRGDLWGRDHGAQHLCLATVIFSLDRVVGGGEPGLALQTIRKKFRGGRFTNSEWGLHGLRAYEPDGEIRIRLSSARLYPER